jgi:alkylation response protein AidB-like acyl-CoA dehydrogenase
MRLDLTDDERAIADVFGAFFRRECPLEVVRKAEPLGFDAAVWTRLADLGAPAMGVAESMGGGGATLTDLAVVADQVGQSIAPVPFVEHAVALRLLAAFDAISDALLTGDEIATVAVRPSDAGGWTLVPAGAVAQAVVGMLGEDLVGVRSDPPGEAPLNHAAMPIANRSAMDATVLATGDAARAAFARGRAEWQTLTATALTGIGFTAQAMALEYVNERHQFDRPIGSFQALQQQLADLPIALEGARLLSYKAAWAGDRDEHGVVDVDLCDVTDFGALAPMAFLFASDAAALATDRSLHAHGGYGYAEEYDIQLFYRRARGWALVAGDPAHECLHLADSMFGPVGG